MTDLVERVARVLSEAGGAANWEHALECARAAIAEVLREWPEIERMRLGKQ